ncbi:glycosyltransferase family 9 protein [Bryobacter aggregatus]|uniref:glycosyltransferase family 9 protein n=1 Tax=Bryobacter aggregatus TaxID=360054 RepID=UPI0004E1E6B2|nr:glycosyltransferase family 9 protein [Bryobacter aggregatus]
MRRLAIRPGGIGDSILGFPALHHLKPTAVWARAEVLPLLPYETLSIETSGIGLLGVAQPAAGLIERIQSFDEIVTWYGSNREEFRAALSGMHPRVRYCEALPPDARLHAADFFAAQVGAPVPALPKIEVQPQPHRLVVIHPFSGSAKKNWLLENYQKLARWLEASGRAVIFVVAPHQVLPGAKVVSNLAELGRFLAGASLYIGNDSGITHLAAACGANVLALFGASETQVWAPRGERVQVLDRGDLDALHVEYVLDAALAKTGFLQNHA